MLEQVVVPRLVVGGVGSGSGKTTITLGLARAMQRRGQSVQTFKVGTDFVDTAYLAHVSQRPCRTLDSWMLGETGVRRAFAHGSSGSDLALVEGNHGIFDGSGAPGDHLFPDSTAAIAHMIGAPLVLVIDVAAMSETAAAIALGIKQLDRELNLIGVILNRANNGSQSRAIEDAVWKLATLPVLGCLPVVEHGAIAQTRNGLLPLSENADADTSIDAIADVMERDCDLDLLQRLMIPKAGLRWEQPHPAGRDNYGPVKIAVAFDDAFSSCYAENLEELQAAGATIEPFSPLEDRALPHDIDAIYIGGCITDAFIPRLAQNYAMLQSMRQANADGIPIYAEGGGMLYCARTVITCSGHMHDLTGIVAVDLQLRPGSLRNGYRELQVATDCLLGPAGTKIRGHEPHPVRILVGAESVDPAFVMHDPGGEPLGFAGWVTRSVVVSPVQVHFGQSPRLARSLLSSAHAHRHRPRLAVVS